MTSSCIHGVPAEQCASCKTCLHGQAAGACVRCRSAALSRKAKAAPPAVVDSPQQHAGYEIYFEPDVSGWRYRATDAAPSELSYRSAFLARKAVDQLASAPAAVATKKASTKRRKA